MTSNARRDFDASCTDINRLLKIHGDIAGTGPGRKHGVLVLNKSAFVLITAFWEAYCEDLAAEGIEHLVKHAPDASQLPTDLQKIIARELKSAKHELAIWQIADGGWRTVMTSRLSTMRADRNRKLNTPKTAQINQLFEDALGIQDIASRWYWQGMTKAATQAKLDEYVTLRGEIAHRGAASGKPTKTQVEDYYNLVKRLVSKTGGRVNTVMRTCTGKPLWE